MSEEITKLTRSFNDAEPCRQNQPDVNGALYSERAQNHLIKLEAIENVTRKIAHEFNNLMVVIRGNLQLIQLEETVRSDAEEISEMTIAAEKASVLSASLLAFARQQAPVPETVDVSHMLDGYSQVIQRAVGEGVKLSVANTPDLWLCMSDQAQLEAALLNLCINACEAMQFNGEITIQASNVTLATDAELNPGDYVKISVLDEGSGISADIIDKVVQPFFTTKSAGESAGLGLSVIYGFAILSGGNLLIESSGAQGAKVSLFLPRANAV